MFTGQSGEIVRVTSGPEGASDVYAPVREASPVRYEYQSSTGTYKATVVQTNIPGRVIGGAKG